MVTNKVHLRIVTPTIVKVDEEVNMVIMRCIDGDMGIMPGHEARSAVLDYGVLRILDDDSERKLAVFGGFAEIKNNMLTVLTSDAEWPDEVDLARAEADREHAEQRLRLKTEDVELQSEQIALRRSLVRIEVSSYSLTYKSSWE